MLAIFITLQEQKRPVPSLIGITQVAPAAGSTRRGGGDSPSYSASTAPDADGVPVVPPREAESTVDYYMNMQALQNLMGMIADIFELATPYLALIGGKDTSPTSFPVTPTLVVLVLLPPAILLPLTPPWAIPYLLLPAGLAPPLFFHPNLHPLFLSLPKSRHAREARAALEDMVLTDGLSDEIGSRPIARVEVWENERLDPAVAAKALVPNQPAPSLPPGSWSARFLRAGERGAWVKVRAPGNLWADEEPKSADADDGRMVLALKHKWTFVPDEDWRVDVPALWSEVGADTGEQSCRSIRAFADINFQRAGRTPTTRGRRPRTSQWMRTHRRRLRLLAVSRVGVGGGDACTSSMDRLSRRTSEPT